jgi:hypothetical protein
VMLITQQTTVEQKDSMPPKCDSKFNRAIWSERGQPIGMKADQRERECVPSNDVSVIVKTSEGETQGQSSWT